jgi:hypothetical protein
MAALPQEEMYQRLADELAELESRGVGRGSPGEKPPKWIPKGPKAIARSPSTEAQLASPPWEQEQARGLAACARVALHARVVLRLTRRLPHY